MSTDIECEIAREICVHRNARVAARVMQRGRKAGQHYDTTVNALASICKRHGYRLDRQDFDMLISEGEDLA